MKKRLRISPTTLDQYRVFIEGAYGGKMTDEGLVERLTSPFVKTESMKLGTACHLIIEKGAEAITEEDSKYFVEWVERNGEECKVEILKHEMDLFLLDRHKYLDGIIEKYTNHYTMEVAGYEVIIPMKYDYIGVEKMIDIKTTQSNYKPSYSSYKESVQWKLYLMSVPDIDDFEIHAYHIKRLKTKQYVLPYVFQYVRSEFDESEVKMMMYGFIKWLERKGLIDYFTEK